MLCLRYGVGWDGKFAQRAALGTPVAQGRIFRGTRYHLDVVTSQPHELFPDLATFPSPVSVGLQLGCRVPSVYLPQHVTPQPTGLPVPKLERLLSLLSLKTPLSYMAIKLIPRSAMVKTAMTSVYEHMEGPAVEQKFEPSCDGGGAMWDPAECLFAKGWGGMSFTLNTAPPFDGNLVVSETTTLNPEKARGHREGVECFDAGKGF